MNDKLNLGDDFTGDEGEVDESKKEGGEEEGDEKKEEEGGEEEGEEKKGEEEEESDDSKKEQELQGLLDTEKELDGDITKTDNEIEAAKDRIRGKRRARREGRELSKNVEGSMPEDEDDTDDLSDIDPETLKVLDRFTKAKGLVPKSELGKMNYENAHKVAESAFFESHPEYLPENDTDDSLFNALKTELSFFAAPKDSTKISKLFEKAHREVSSQYPDKFKGEKKKTVTDDTKKSSALVKKQSVGGGSSGGGSGSSKKEEGSKDFSPKQISALQDGGWSDEEIKELTG